MPGPLDTHATADQILGLHLSRWQDRAREAEARIVEMEAKLVDAEKDIEEHSGYIDRIDTQVSEALKAIGKFPPKPAGMADRIDVACDLLVSLSAAEKEARPDKPEDDGMEYAHPAWWRGYDAGLKAAKLSHDQPLAWTIEPAMPDGLYPVRIMEDGRVFRLDGTEVTTLDPERIKKGLEDEKAGRMRPLRDIMAEIKASSPKEADDADRA